MDEARKFLRYILPGLVFATQLLIALLISNYEATTNLLATKMNLGIVVSFIFASGGLGYIFSIIYFGIYWSKPFNKWLPVDNLSVIRELKEYLIIVKVSGQEFSSDELSRQDAWIIITSAWHSRVEGSESIKGTNIKTNILANVTHGLGATLVGSFFSFGTWIFLHFFIINSSSRNLCWLGLILLSWLLFLFLSVTNYLHASHIFQSLINTTFANEMKKEYSNNKNKKVEIVFTT